MLALTAIAVVALASMRVSSFSLWQSRTFAVSIAELPLAGLSILLCLTWMALAFGVSWPLALPVVSLPTLYCAAFVTAWPAPVLAIPLSLILSLALGADRRIVARP